MRKRSLRRGDQAASGIYITPPPALGGILEVNGTMSGGALQTAIDSNWAASSQNGKMTVRPSPGSTLTAQGWFGSKNGLTCENVIFDGLLSNAETAYTDRLSFGFYLCEFKNYFVGAGVNDQHSQGIAIWGGCDGGLIQECYFHDNGTTSHIWLSYFGSNAGAGWYDTNNYPKNICVKGCSFGRTYGAYFAMHYATPLPGPAAGLGNHLEPTSNYLISQSLLAGQRNPELIFDSTFTGLCP